MGSKNHFPVSMIIRRAKRREGGSEKLVVRLLPKDSQVKTVAPFSERGHKNDKRAEANLHSQ